MRDFKGFASMEVQSFVQDRDTPLDDEQLIFELQLELDVQLLSNLRFFVQPWFFFNALDTDLLRYEPLEAYLELAGESWDIRLGQFVESWGIADTFNPLDVLNRRDAATDVIDPELRGETGVRVRYAFEGGSVIDQPALSVYAIPVWRETPFPTDENRFSFAQGAFAIREDAADKPDFVDGILAAARFDHTLNTGPIKRRLAIHRGPRPPTVFPHVWPRDGRGRSLCLSHLLWLVDFLAAAFAPFPTPLGGQSSSSSLRWSTNGPTNWILRQSKTCPMPTPNTR